MQQTLVKYTTRHKTDTTSIVLMIATGAPLGLGIKNVIQGHIAIASLWITLSLALLVITAYARAMTLRRAQG